MLPTRTDQMMTCSRALGGARRDTRHAARRARREVTGEARSGACERSAALMVRPSRAAAQHKCMRRCVRQPYVRRGRWSLLYAARV